MYYCDSHTHTKYSFDSTSDIRENCEAAVAAGFSELVITDHYECNFEKDGINEEYDAESAYAEISAVKKEYEGRLTVTYGIELGQATQDIAKAEKLLGSYPFEFVLGSLHNLANVPDFYFIDYREMPESMFAKLWERYLAELDGIIEYGRFSAIAHITYPLRYPAVYGKRFDVSYTYPQIDALFRKMIAKDMALEVNTSGLRKPIGETSPDIELVKRYLGLGGKYITVGSDAHRTCDVGAGVKETYDRLITAGLENITVFRNGKPELIKIV